MILTVFRYRLNASAEAEYRTVLPGIVALAESMPGFISRKVFFAEDGERVILVEFEDEKSQLIWAKHPEHVAAKAKGRKRFYSEYSIQVCNIARDSRYLSK
jgi:heme-degrading monooxygenase HmoA